MSKYDHEPFSVEEYEKLHQILAKPDLPFSNMSFEEITESEEDVDGVSGATKKSISKYVIKGAAYTTYKLWTTIYGSASLAVMEHTESKLTNPLLHRILESKNIADKLWALERIDKHTELDEIILTSWSEFISGDDFYLAYMALNSISPIHLRNMELQSRLINAYKSVDNNIQDLIIKKLGQAPFINPFVVKTSHRLLPNLNGKQLVDMLNLYSEFLISDLETCEAVSELLKSNNRFVSAKAYEFLGSVDVEDSKIKKGLKNYEQETLEK